MFGHQFTLRLGLCSKGSKEQSYVFTQFLDCVWQLQLLFPTAFEFNDATLVLINTAAVTSSFGKPSSLRSVSLTCNSPYNVPIDPLSLSRSHSYPSHRPVPTAAVFPFQLCLLSI